MAKDYNIEKYYKTRIADEIYKINLAKANIKFYKKKIKELGRKRLTVSSKTLNKKD